MKKLLLVLLLTAANFAASKTEAAPAKPQKTALKWPTFRPIAAKKSVPQVAAIQYLLRARGFYRSKPDGVFGVQTAASVRAFQRKNGLKADGIVAAQTFSRLLPTLKRGDKGDAVRALQTLLNGIISNSEVHGDRPLKLDGVFGFETESMLRFHQSLTNDFKDSRMHLKEDGIANTRTWWVLFVNP